MTTFTKVCPTTEGEMHNRDTASVTITPTSPVAAGDIMIAVVDHREGVGHPNFSVTDSNGGTWTKLGGNNYGGANRLSVGVYMFQPDSAYVAADSTPDVTASNSGATDNALGFQLAVYRPSELREFVLEASAMANGDPPDGVNSGNAVASGTDMFVFAVGVVRSSNFVVNAPDYLNFDEITGEHQFSGNPSWFSTCTSLAILTSGQGSGTYTATLDTDSDGSNDHGMAAVFVLRDAPTNVDFDMTPGSMTYTGGTLDITTNTRFNMTPGALTYTGGTLNITRAFKADPIPLLPAAPTLLTTDEEYHNAKAALVSGLQSYVTAANAFITAANATFISRILGEVTEGGDVMIEEDESAAGKYTKFACGLIACRRRLELPTQNVFHAGATYTYPVAGLTGNVITATLDVDTNDYGTLLRETNGAHVSSLGANSAFLFARASDGIWTGTGEWDITHYANWFTPE